MKSAFYKDILRTVKKSFPRFISLMAIMALGLTVFLGIAAACSDLFRASDRFYDEQQLFDVRILSTLGLTEADVDALMRVKGITVAEGMYSETVKTTLNGREQSVEMIMLSSKGLNNPYLLEGTIPVKQGEIAVTQKYIDVSGKSIGDSLEITEKQSNEGALSSPASGSGIVSGSGISIDDDIDIGLESNPVNFKNTKFTITSVVVDAQDTSVTVDGAASYRSTSTSDFVFFVNEADVQTDVFSSIALRFDHLEQLDCYSSEYKEEVMTFIKTIESNIMKQREQARYEEVIRELTNTIAKAEAVMSEKFAEYDTVFKDAWEELANARMKISDGEEGLINSEGEIATQFREARAKISDGKNAINNSINSARSQLQKGEANYYSGLTAYNSNNNQYSASMKETDALNNGVNSSIPNSLGTIQALMSTYPTNSDWASASTQNVNSFRSASNTITGILDTMANMLSAGGGASGASILNGISSDTKTALNSGDYVAASNSLLSLNTAYNPPSTDTPIALMNNSISSTYKSLSDAKVQLDDVKKQLDSAKKLLDKGNDDYKNALVQINNARAELSRNEAGLNEQELAALTKMADAWIEIANSKLLLIDGETQLADEELKYTDKKMDAKQKISDAYAGLEDIDMTQWYVQDRTSISSYSGFEGNLGSISAIAKVFPIIFLIVAILMSLTTMTRMVEEERGLIGTYKALGYSNKKIGSKYIIYALLALILGSILGIILGFFALSSIFVFVLKTLYFVPDVKLAVYPLNAILGTLLFIFCILITTAFACRKELKQNPATIMRPKAPRNGSRVLLERIPIIWTNLKFLNKITSRNLFRYKKRLVMTIIGIAGCTALIILGFAIRDSAYGVIPKQYENVFRYDMMVIANPAGYDEMLEFVSSEKEIADFLPICIEAAKAYNENGDSEGVQIVVVPDGESLFDYIGTFDLKGNKIELEDAGIFITPNAANLLKLEAGSTIHIQNLLLDRRTTVVSEVVENYLGNFVYITESHYKALFDEYVPNAIFAHLIDNVDDQKAYAEKLLENDFVAASFSKPGLKAQFEAENEVLNKVVIVMILLAALLAFIVLFTLSNTNISERDREIATIKVLGFYNREVYKYINKETLILTIIGTLLGLPLGYFVSKIFMAVIELPSLELVLTIKGISYLISAIIAIAFALIVNKMTNRTLKKIDMIGALKSVE